MGELKEKKTVSFDYDRVWAGEWEDMKKYGPVSRHIRRILIEIIVSLEFDSVLDVGCGQGSFLKELVTEFPKISPCGIDVSSAAVELASARVPQGKFWVLDIERERLEKTFDLVVCSEVLEHIPEDLSALKNLAHMTGKYIVISTLQGRMRSFEAEEVGHVRNYAPGELVQKTREAGLKILRVLEWGFPFYSPMYRNLIELTGARGTTGEFGVLRKTVSLALYHLFKLNSSKRGDEIFILAEHPGLR
jgi:ubiquinone/menaquinone biosynthesis C-methylase UbiE